MNSKRLYFALLGVIGLLIIGLIAGAFAVDNFLTSRSQSLIASRLQVAVLAEDQRQLTKAKADIKKYQDLATIAKSVVPQDKDQAQAVRQIVDIANANGVSLSSVSFPSSTLGTSLSKGSSEQQLSQLIPVKGVSGVYNLQITVQSDAAHPVAYAKFIAFLDALEHNRRTAEVSSINIQPSATDRNNLSFNLVLEEYIKP